MVIKIFTYCFLLLPAVLDCTFLDKVLLSFNDCSYNRRYLVQFTNQTLDALTYVNEELKCIYKKTLGISEKTKALRGPQVVEKINRIISRSFA